MAMYPNQIYAQQDGDKARLFRPFQAESAELQKNEQMIVNIAGL